MPIAKMPDGTLIESQWGYCPGVTAVERAEVIRQIRPRIVSIWAVMPSTGVLDCLGSGFVLNEEKDSQGNFHAIVGTAEHVLSHGIRVLNPAATRSRVGPFSFGSSYYLRSILEKSRLLVTFPTETGYRSLPVRRASYSPRADLALLVVRSTEASESFLSFAVDSDPLETGTIVTIAGYPHMHGTEDAGHSLLDGQNHVSRQVQPRLDIRSGTIVSVEQSMRHKGVFGYELSVPIPPGMSGGPAFAFRDTPGKGLFSPFSVVGVCSSDATPPEQADEIRVAGSSFIIGTQNFYAVPDPCGATIRTWTSADPASRASPPFGHFYDDVGSRKKELRLDLSSEEGPLVARMTI
ncbi:MAG: serine protease [Dehalococcoidia bacterium]